jgi:hypothetical protein
MDSAAETGYRESGFLPIFHHDDGRCLLPTARHIWDLLLEEQPELEQSGAFPGAGAVAAFSRVRGEAEKQGAAVFQELCVRFRQRLKRDQEKGEAAFQVRRESLERLGLPEVRRHRLRRLEEEERAWAAKLQSRQQILPDLQAVLLLRVEAGDG